MMRLIATLGLLAACLVGIQPASAAKSTTHMATVGVTAHSIKLGGVIDQTGRGTLVSKPILGGYKLAVKEIDAHGGINHRRIDYTALSDDYDPSQTLPQVRQLVESDKVFAMMGVFGSDDSAQAAPYLERKHIPFFDPIGGGLSVKGKHWVWQTEPDYAREGKVIAKYLGGKLHARRVAVLYQVGVGETQVASIRKTLPKYHSSLVGTASYQATDSNLAGQVIRLRSHNPDIVVLNGTPIPTSIFLQYARSVSFKPKYGFLANYPMGDPLWIGLVGAKAEGIYVSSYADLTGHNRVANAYRHAIAKYHGEKYSNYGLYGYFNGTLFFKALKLAGKKLTRPRLLSILNSRFRHYNTGFTGPINWTPKDHFGAREFKIYRIKSRKLTPITGWLNP